MGEETNNLTSSQDSAQLEDDGGGDNSSGAVGGDGVSLVPESTEIPPQNEQSAKANLSVNGAISEPPSSSEAVSNPLFALLQKCKEVIAGRKQKRLDKIVEMLISKEKVSNRDVCKALRVSDSTAVRYLNELEKQGRVKQVGKTGRDSFYQLIQ